MAIPGTPGASVPPGEDWLVRRVADLERRLNELAAADPLRPAGVRAIPGQIASLDYDGTGRADLGDNGWSLGSPDGGPSYLSLNGIDVYADLAAKTSALASAQSQLQAQADYQASLITRDATTAAFNTGTLISDSQFHFVGGQAATTVNVATGKVRVTLGNDEVSVAPSGGSVIAQISYGVDGLVPLDPNFRLARIYAPNITIGMSVSRTATLTMTPGTYTFRAQASYWCVGSASASVNYATTRLMVEVIGND